MRKALLAALSCVAVAAALGAAARPAFAQYQGLVSLPPVGPGDSRLLLGGGVVVGPAYPGSNDVVWSLRPYFDYQNKNGLFFGTVTGLGYSIVNTAETQFGVRLVPVFGRDEGNSDDLRGMGDVDPSVEASVFWTRALSPAWTVGLNGRAGKYGAELDFGARRDFQLQPTMRLSLVAFGTVGNGKSNQTFFGVDAAQSLASGYPVYDPGAGLRSLNAGATFNYFFAGRWIALGGLGLNGLVGDVADSPIVRRRTTMTGFVAVGYQVF